MSSDLKFPVKFPNGATITCVVDSAGYVCVTYDQLRYLNEFDAHFGVPQTDATYRTWSEVELRSFIAGVLVDHNLIGTEAKTDWYRKWADECQKTAKLGEEIRQLKTEATEATVKDVEDKQQSIDDVWDDIVWRTIKPWLELLLKV